MRFKGPNPTFFNYFNLGQGKTPSRTALLCGAPRKGEPGQKMTEDEKRALISQIRDLIVSERETRFSRQSPPDPGAQAPASPPSDGQSAVPDPQIKD